MNKSTLAKHAALALTASAVVYALCTPGLAEAETLAGVACTFETNYVGDYLVNGSGIGNLSPGGIFGSERQLHCPAPTSFRTGSSSIFIDVFDGNNDVAAVWSNVSARVCMQPFGVTPSVRIPPNCGPNDFVTTGTFSGSTFGTLSAANVNLLQTSPMSHYADIIVTLPEGGTFGASQLFGMQN
jgi:hypothetical protein